MEGRLTPEDVNYLNFDLDGAVQFFISGSVGWEQRTTTLPAGNHTLRWAFDEDVGGLANDAGWVDQVKWTANTGPERGDLVLPRIHRQVQLRSAYTEINISLNTPTPLFPLTGSPCRKHRQRSVTNSW